MKRMMVAILLMAVVFGMHMDTIAAPVDHWYIRHTETHEIPALDPRFSFMEHYDAHYLGPERNSDEKTIYLTFDLGYVNENVKNIAQTLRQNQVPACFFILRQICDKEQDFLRELISDGHTIGNHSARHKDPTKLSEEEFTRELDDLREAFRGVTDTEIAHFYRPPEGKFNEQVLTYAQKMGYQTVFWSYAYADWDNAKQPDPQKSLNRILENAHNREILLLHPTSHTNAVILSDLIQGLRAQGYRFGSLTELCNEKEGASESSPS